MKTTIAQIEYICPCSAIVKPGTELHICQNCGDVQCPNCFDYDSPFCEECISKTNEKGKVMKLYAVETTDRMQLCKINARNIIIYGDLQEAKRRAVIVALANCQGKVRSSSNIAFDKFLDGVMAVFDSSEGGATEAEALAFITLIHTH